MIMAWLAVDKDGTELIFESHPLRAGAEKTEYSEKLINRNQTEGCWYGKIINVTDYDTFEYYDEPIELPKGTIQKLIGRELTWKDETVCLLDTETV